MNRKKLKYRPRPKNKLIGQEVSNIDDTQMSQDTSDETSPKPNNSQSVASGTARVEKLESTVEEKKRIKDRELALKAQAVSTKAELDNTKQTVSLTYILKLLLKALKGEDSDKDDKKGTPAAKSKTLGGSLKGALTDSIRTKVDGVKQMASMHGILDIASSAAGNGIVGSILGAGADHLKTVKEEKQKKTDFLDNFGKGTEIGRQTYSDTYNEHLKENRGDSKGAVKAANKAVAAEGILHFDKKSEVEANIGDLSEKRAALKAKNSAFDLSERDLTSLDTHKKTLVDVEKFDRSLKDDIEPQAKTDTPMPNVKEKMDRMPQGTGIKMSSPDSESIESEIANLNREQLSELKNIVSALDTANPEKVPDSAPEPIKEDAPKKSRGKYKTKSNVEIQSKSTEISEKPEIQDSKGLDSVREELVDLNTVSQSQLESLKNILDAVSKKDPNDKEKRLEGESSNPLKTGTDKKIKGKKEGKGIISSLVGDAIGGAKSLVGKGLMAAAPYAVPALAVGAAGAVGYGAGTLLNNWLGTKEDGTNRIAEALGPSDKEFKKTQDSAEEKEILKQGQEKLASGKQMSSHWASVLTKNGITVPADMIRPERGSVSNSPSVTAPTPVKTPGNTENMATAVKEKAVTVQDLKDAPVAPQQNIVNAPTNVTTNNSTTNMNRQPVRNQEPSFCMSLRHNFI